LTEQQVTELLDVLGRCAVALEANATLYKKHMAEDKRRYSIAEKRYAEEKKLQAEYLRRNRKVTDGTLDALDRQAFQHELRMATLGLRVPDTVPPNIEEST
jgi:hypothetical protein